MIKLSSGKFWISLISICCIGTGIAIACAGGWDEEYGSSNFSPELFVDSAYSPFFLSDQFYYKIGHDENHDTRFNNANIKEWDSFLQNNARHEEIAFFLQEARASAIDSALLFIAGKKTALPAAMQSFSLFSTNTNKKLVAFLSYLQLAKKAEDFAVNNFKYSWDYESKPRKISFDAGPLNRDLQNAFTASKDIFLKERYWFQQVRSFYFNGTPQQTISLFNSQQQLMPHDNMYYRTLSYAAGAYYKLKDFTHANYYYSLVYAGCDALKTTAHYSFQPQEEKDWNATLALCSNSQEKATLWQMLGVFYKDEYRSMQEIYALNPASDKLDLLLARTVNKYEQGFSESSRMYTAFDTASVNASVGLITKIATAGNTRNPWIWYMATGYLNTLEHKYAAAGNWFSKTEKILPPDKLAIAQLRLLRLINTIGQAKIIDAKLENNILADIEWLQHIDNKALPNLRYSTAFSWLTTTMAEKYRKQKDWVKAECFNSKPLFYADNKKVEALKAFLEKAHPSPYEKLCSSLTSVKTGHIFEYQAIHLAYADSLDAAIESMLKADVGSAVVLAGNPFNGRILDCHDCDHAAPQKIKYTKLSFLQKLKEMKDKLSKGEDAYTNALLMGNGYYNISHFGNARFFYEGRIIGEGMSAPWAIDSVFVGMLTNMRMASKYYTLALQNAINDEQKAKCQYMLAKCQRNQWYNQYIYGKKDRQYDTDGMVDLSYLAGFRALKQYANTQYYKEVIKECGYFSSYSGKK